MKQTHFPCWVCKAKGEWIEPVLDDGSGPTESCGYCNGEGLIEIRGQVHRRNTVNGIMGEIYVRADYFYLLSTPQGDSDGERLELLTIRRNLESFFGVKNEVDR